MSERPVEHLLTRQDRQILQVLGDQPARPYLIATRARIHTSSPGETAARHCIKLVRLGLAQKWGTSMYPEWSISTAGMDLLTAPPAPQKQEEGE